MKDQDRITKEKNTVKEDEIDLISLAKILWEGRRTIIKTVIIFAFLGCNCGSIQQEGICSIINHGAAS